MCRPLTHINEKRIDKVVAESPSLIGKAAAKAPRAAPRSASCGLGGESRLRTDRGHVCLVSSLGSSNERTKPSQLVGSGNRTAALAVVIATCLPASHAALQWPTTSGLRGAPLSFQMGHQVECRRLLRQTQACLLNSPRSMFFDIHRRVVFQRAFFVPPTGGWAGWGRWSACSQECGGGVQVRSRSCQPEDGVCEGTVEEGRACNTQPCVGKPTRDEWNSARRQVEFKAIHSFHFLLGKERSRNQGPRGIVGLKRDNADDSNYGAVATQTGDIGEKDWREQ